MLSFSKHFSTTIIMIVTLLFIFSGCSDSPSTPIPQPTPTTGIIQGIVSDEFAVIPNAYLKFYHFQNNNENNTPFTTITNEKGEYLINNLPSGEGLIEVWLSKDGHDNQTENPIANYRIIIISGTTIVQNIKSGHFDAYGKYLK